MPRSKAGSLMRGLSCVGGTTLSAPAIASRKGAVCWWWAVAAAVVASLASAARASEGNARVCKIDVFVHMDERQGRAGLRR